MIAAVLLAVACAKPPLYDMSGPECIAPTGPCQCSECATWSPFPGAHHYDVKRTDANGVEQLVGTSAVHGEYYTDDDPPLWIPRDPVELWCFQKDDPPPVEGARYTYKFRACTGPAASSCTPWTARNDGLPIIYFGAPMMCFDNGVRMACGS